MDTTGLEKNLHHREWYQNQRVGTDITPKPCCKTQEYYWSMLLA